MPPKKKRRGPPRVKIKVATEWMSVDEATEYLRLSSAHALYQLVRRGVLPAYRLGKRSLIFSRSELDAHIRSQQVTPAKKRPKPS